MRYYYTEQFRSLLFDFNSYFFFYVPDHSVEKESCLVFLTNVTDNSSRSMFIEFDTKYFAFGAKYSFDTKIGACYETSLQKVEGLLICEGPTGNYLKYLQM